LFSLLDFLFIVTEKEPEELGSLVFDAAKD
jgi:hypothetical protein